MDMDVRVDQSLTPMKDLIDDVDVDLLPLALDDLDHPGPGLWDASSASAPWLVWALIGGALAGAGSWLASGLFSVA